jgi:hypothetical protein
VPSVEVEEPIGVGCAATTEVCEDKLAVSANVPDKPLALERRVRGAAKIAHRRASRANFRAACPSLAESGAVISRSARHSPPKPGSKSP